MDIHPYDTECHNTTRHDNLYMRPISYKIGYQGETK